MASLIPAEVIEQMLSRQQAAQNPTQASPQQMMAAMPLSTAHALRQRQMGESPFASHMRDSKAAGTGKPVTDQAPAQHDFNPQAAAGAGTMSVTASGHNPMNQAGMQAWGARMKHDAEARGGTYTPNVTQPPAHGTDDQKLSLIHQMLQKGQGAQINLQPQLNGFAVQGGTASGQQQGQAVDPVVGMVNAFKGHVPDQLLAAAQQAINSGMHPAQVFSHLQSAMQQQAKPAAAAKPDHTMLQAKLHHLEAQQKTASDHGEDTTGFEKQIQDSISQLGPQQGQQQPPQAGPVQIQSPDESANLPAGSQFVFNGHIYRKK